jgi:hypothetical protein
MPLSTPVCADCGTRGNITRDADGVHRCGLCSKAAFDRAMDARALDAAQSRGELAAHRATVDTTREVSR